MIKALQGRKRAMSIVAAAAVSALALTGVGVTAANAADVTLNVAVVSNSQMLDMQKLLPKFEAANPGIKVKFTILDEITLREKLQQDVTSKSGLFDVAMVGVVEAPIWAQNGWTVDLQDYASKSSTYDLNDIFPAIRNGLSYKGHLYAAPFYGESTFTMYRKDLLKAAGVTLPANPTWDDIEKAAKAANNPAKGVAGICLRGQTGWGSNLPINVTMIHNYGGSIFTPGYKGNLSSAASTAAVNKYMSIMKYGEKGATNSSFPECLNLFNSGKAAIWVDATSAGSLVVDPSKNKNYKNVGFAANPAGPKGNGGWIWAWSLAVLKTSKNQDAAWKFLEWSTSKSYIELAGNTPEIGWAQVPPGTRTSTYANANYKKAAAAFAPATLAALKAAKSSAAGRPATEATFYVGIPEWTGGTGADVSKQITAALAGQKSVKAALAAADAALNKMAKAGGYQK